MENFNAFMQLVFGSAALYATLYQTLKKKYERLENSKLDHKQCRRKKESIENILGLLNTIYVIIFIFTITFYCSPFRGFFRFFGESIYGMSYGKALYIVFSVISSIILFLLIYGIEIWDELAGGYYQYFFYSFLYIYFVIVLLRLNQIILAFCIKNYLESLVVFVIITIMIHMLMNFVIFILYIVACFVYLVLMEFVEDKFTKK